MMVGNRQREHLTIPQVAKILGLSRIAIFKKVKNGEIKAVKIGRNYAISRKHFDSILGKSLNAEDKREIETAVRKTVSEYGRTLKLLGKN